MTGTRTSPRLATRSRTPKASSTVRGSARSVTIPSTPPRRTQKSRRQAGALPSMAQGPGNSPARVADEQSALPPPAAPVQATTALDMPLPPADNTPVAAASAIDAAVLSPSPSRPDQSGTAGSIAAGSPVRTSGRGKGKRPARRNAQSRRPIPAQGLPSGGSSGDDSSPDGGPSDDPSDLDSGDVDSDVAENLEDEVRSLPLGGAVNRKNLTIELFTGKVPSGAFDSGVRTWWRRFSHQLLLAQAMAGRRWTPLQQKGVFESSLSEDADEWFQAFKFQRPNASLRKCGSALVQQFKCDLSEQEILITLIKEPKRASETYRQYAYRLIAIADALPGGTARRSNTRQALQTFVKRAYPAVSQTMRSMIQQQKRKDPVTLLHLAVRHLSLLVESDGKRREKTSNTTQGASKKLKRNDGQSAPTVMVATVERKRKQHRRTQGKPGATSVIKSEWTPGPNTRCYNYNGYGHIASACPQPPRKQTGRNRVEETGVAALADELTEDSE
ncbi:hypothetical protein BBJ28_00023160 [Nothophytophthora sp. Chile5]|nr:hypothetical protein BBJ28_00023160 [Nothophytophthora sp. Chile5]